jgi:hypothetical protein
MNHSLNPDEPKDGGHHGAPCGGIPIAGRERTQPIRSHNGEANGSKQDERADDQFLLSLQYAHYAAERPVSAGTIALRLSSVPTRYCD